jgi:thiamine biosynthesis lipoprotein
LIRNPFRQSTPGVLAFVLPGLVLCLALSAALSRSARAGALAEHKFYALRMGTEFRVLIYADDAIAAQKAAIAAFDRVEQLENIMSDYRTDSEVMHLCSTAVQTPQSVTPDLFYVLQNALRMSELSGGAFDVTIGPVVQVWREAKKKKQLPDPGEIGRARRQVGYKNVVLNSDARTVELRIPNMRIDLGGIGKGYAADQALEVLKTMGFSIALVQGGGEVVAGDPPPGKPGWKIAIRKPDPADADAPGYLLVHNKGISTSGDGFQYLEVNGQRYSHIINPADGMGLRNSPAVTILAPNGITADALSTALDIMPVPAGLALAESIEGAFAVITRKGPAGFEHFYSRGFPKIPDEKTKTTVTPRPQRIQ